VLGPEGREPVIVVGVAGGRTLFLWPFELGRSAGLKVLHWLGQEHASYAMGLFAPEAAALAVDDLTHLLDAVAHHTGAAAAILKAQPFDWDGSPNPLAKLRWRLAPSRGYAVSLGDFRTLYEKRFSKRSRRVLDLKEKKLAGAGSLTFGWAETRGERLELIETLFAQKARQFAAMGVPDIFDTHARAFYRELALLEGDNPSRLRLGYLKVDGEVLATFSGTVCHGRMSGVLCSLADGHLQRLSPGALLLKHQIEEACGKGLAVYDIGAGEARHKDQWCDVVQPLFDTFIAFKPHGLTLTLPLAALSRLKRAMKSNPHLWPVAQKVRARLFGDSRTGV
jgi:CelD/BcsL family acetyltransferase involved in cellulose biosynthesis